MALPALADHELPINGPDGEGRFELPPPHRILVVDDVPSAAETLATILRSRGHEVRVAFDGLSAIESVLADRPEVVLLDVAMPGLDGYEIARRLRQRPQLKDLLLVALTGYGDQESRRQALAAGFDYHIVKTADIEELESVFPGRQAES